jgi:hypothetical protein
MSSEGPYIHRSDSLPKQITRALKEDPRQIVPLIVSAIQKRQIKVGDDFHGYNLDQRLSRRRLIGTGLRASAAAGLAMNLPELAKTAGADDSGIYTNPVPWSSPDYFPIDINVAHHKGLQTLDEEGGPLHVLSLAHEWINGTPKNLHLWWNEEVTARYIALNYKYNGGAGLGDAGYCPELAATQIHKPIPKLNWAPDTRNNPDFKAKNQDYAIGKTAITGMYVAMMAGGVVYLPEETKEKSPYGPTSAVQNNLNTFFTDFQAMPPGSDRLPIIESPINWHRAVREFSADGQAVLAENFGNAPIWLPTRSIVWTQKRYSYKDAQKLQKSGQIQFSREAMNQNAALRNPDLDENFIDYLAGLQLTYS